MWWVRRRWRGLNSRLRRRLGAFGLAVAACAAVSLAVANQGGGFALFAGSSSSSSSSSSRKVVLVTTALSRSKGGGGAAAKEYGEVKAAYVYAASVDNKARYAAARGWDLWVASASLEEGAARSARWQKVAWLRRLVAEANYDWVVWMDLDCFFTTAQLDILNLMDDETNEAVHAHFTPDAGAVRRVNTGFFALRVRAPWTTAFLERVWADNDRGEGLSDQRSFNRILDALPRAEREAHVRVHDRRVFNAFPRVREAYVPCETYEAPATDGDETRDTAVVHFAGQFGGARLIDGATPPTMLVQFLDLMLRRHERFVRQTTTAATTTKEGTALGTTTTRPRDEALAVLRRARSALETCLGRIRAYVETDVHVEGYGAVRSFQPRDPESACDAEEALQKCGDALYTLLRVDGGTSSSSSSETTRGRGESTLKASLLCHEADDLVAVASGRLRSPRRREDLTFVGGGSSAAFLDAIRAQLFAQKKHVAASSLLTVVDHECATYNSRACVADAESVVALSSGGQDRRAVEEDPCAFGPTERRSRRVVLIDSVALDDDNDAADERHRKGKRSGRGHASALGGGSEGSEEEEEDALWLTREAPLALLCLASAPPGAEVFAVSSPRTAERWALLGVAILTPLRGATAAYADHVYSCHLGASTSRNALATLELKRVRDALLLGASSQQPASSSSSSSVGGRRFDVALACGGAEHLGFRDCGPLVAALASAGVADVAVVSQGGASSFLATVASALVVVAPRKESGALLAVRAPRGQGAVVEVLRKNHHPHRGALSPPPLPSLGAVAKSLELRHVPVFVDPSTASRSVDAVAAEIRRALDEAKKTKTNIMGDDEA